MSDKLIVIVGAGGLHTLVDRLLINHPDLTAPIYPGPPPVNIVLRREEPIIPDMDFRRLREPKKRDWEQRQTKRKRK